MAKKTALNTQNAKTQKTEKDKFQKTIQRESIIEPGNDSEFGGLPLRDFKKNLGCGG